QKGRYREFYQCDADVVGTTSLVCEAEIILMIKAVFTTLNITDYTIKINHRDVLNGVADLIGARGNETALFVAIDKLDKIGEEKVKEELVARGFPGEGLSYLFELLNAKGSNTEKLAFLKEKFKSNESGTRGVADLEHVLSLLVSMGSNEQHVTFDIPLA